MATKPIQIQEFKDKQERLKALRARANSTNKSLGIQGLSRASDLMPYRRCGSGIPEFDKATGDFLIHGGFVTVWGPKAAGKTTLALKTAAKAQAEGKIVYWIAQENFDPLRAAWAGCNMDELQVGQFPQGEMALDSIIDFARRKLVDVIILDSIHSMSMKAQQENSKGEKSVAENTMGAMASKLSVFFPIALDPIKRAEIAVLLIGQARVNIGAIVSLEQLSGGNALTHNSRMILKCSRGPNDDSPKKITYVQDGDKKKKVEEIIGFSSCYRFEKVQVPNCLTEKSVLTLPYYFESGYDLPQFIKDENAEIEKQTSGTNVEEESHQIPLTNSLTETNPYATDKEALKNAVETSTAIEIGPKRAKKALEKLPPVNGQLSEPCKVIRKRGRPKKENK